MLSRGDERSGLICHNKYTNPAAIADTTTKCMNSLLTIDCCNVSDAGNQRLVYGYREMGFQTTYFKILVSGMRGVVTGCYEVSCYGRQDRPRYNQSIHICLLANSRMMDINDAIEPAVRAA